MKEIATKTSRSNIQRYPSNEGCRARQKYLKTTEISSLRTKIHLLRKSSVGYLPQLWQLRVWQSVGVHVTRPASNKYLLVVRMIFTVAFRPLWSAVSEDGFISPKWLSPWSDSAKVLKEVSTKAIRACTGEEQSSGWKRRSHRQARWCKEKRRSIYNPGKMRGPFSPGDSCKKCSGAEQLPSMGQKGRRKINKSKVCPTSFITSDSDKTISPRKNQYESEHSGRSQHTLLYWIPDLFREISSTRRQRGICKPNLSYDFLLQQGHLAIYTFYPCIQLVTLIK